MIDEVFFILLTVAVLCVGAVRRPKHLRAPAGFYFEGVRPNGETTVREAPPMGCGEPIPPDDKPCPNGHAIGARIYCTNGTQPIVVDERTIGCQRGGYP